MTRKRLRIEYSMSPSIISALLPASQVLATKERGMATDETDKTVPPWLKPLSWLRMVVRPGRGLQLRGLGQRAGGVLLGVALAALAAQEHRLALDQHLDRHPHRAEPVV